jgi:hypothetical protein
MQYRVTGIDATTGENRVVTVESNSEKEALLRAKPLGVFASQEPLQGQQCKKCHALISWVRLIDRDAICQGCIHDQYAIAEQDRLRTAKERIAKEKERLTVGNRRWKYEMVQIPPNVAVSESADAIGVAANYLKRIVEQYAALGWEFYRIDQIGVSVNPGCLLALLGERQSSKIYYVVTFRIPVE